MRRIFERPKMTYTALIVAAVALFALSSVGNSGTEQQNAKSSVGWIGAIGWFGFLLDVLALMIFTVALLVLRTRGRRRQTV